MSNEQPEPWIIDATDESFQKDVIERSSECLCIVDFWAEWCAPCRMLGPVLEEVTREFKGQFILVKVNTENAQKVSMDYGIQSIPAVFAFINGEPVDGFAGVLPKDQITEWIKAQLAGDEIRQAIHLADTDPQSAIKVLEDLRQGGESPETADNAEITIALANAYLETGAIEKTTSLIEELEARGFLEPEAEKIKAKLDMQSLGEIDLDEAAARAKAEPDNLEIQLEYASALFGHSRHQEGFEVCLEVVQRDKKGVGDKARELMVEVFRTLPDDSELTSEYRRRLSMALY